MPQRIERWVAEDGSEHQTEEAAVLHDTTGSMVTFLKASFDGPKTKPELAAWLIQNLDNLRMLAAEWQILQDKKSKACLTQDEGAKMIGELLMDNWCGQTVTTMRTHIREVISIARRVR